MQLARNRYDPNDLLSQLARQRPTRDIDEWCLRFICHRDDSQVDDFVAYLPSSEQEHARAIEQYQMVLRSINELDNFAQSYFEDKCLHSSYGVSNYKLHIAYLLLSEGGVKVHYWGTVVNTEGEASFELASDGTWTPVSIELDNH